jgi:hypothetical protein
MLNTNQDVSHAQYLTANMGESKVRPDSGSADGPLGGRLAGFLESDAEHRLEVVLRIDLEGDVGVGLGDPGHLREL